MPSYERTLDLVQGYNFKKDVQLPIGFITYLSIGTGQIVPADQTISTPITNIATPATVTAAAGVAGSLKVVSVLKRIKWDLGDIDPIEFEGTLSVTGKQFVMSLLYATMIDIDVSVSFVVYEYDPVARVYFVAFSNTVITTGDVPATASAGIRGLVRKESGALKLEVSPTPAAEVQSPENYDFKLTVSPQPLNQQLFLAAANTRRVTKYWGRLGPPNSSNPTITTPKG